MASGCLVISEKLNKQTLIDLDMKNAIIQIESPFDLNKSNGTIWVNLIKWYFDQMRSKKV